MEYPYLNIFDDGKEASLQDDAELTVAVAEQIRSFPGSISISDVNSLPPEFIASLLEEYAGPKLSVSGHRYLTPESAAALSGFRGDLTLIGDFDLTPEVAESLSKVEGSLNIADVEKLSADAASYLATHRGYLGLNGVQNLSDEAAAALSKHEGSLDLNSLSQISEAACLELAKHRECVGMENLDLDALAPAAVEAFKKAWPDVWGDV